MKKKLLLFSFLLVSSFRSFGQDKPESLGLGLHIGATAAIHNTWIIIDNEYPDNEHHKHNFTFGPAAGLVLGYKFNQKHSAQLEGFYSKQGAKYDLLDADNNKTVGKKEIDLHYIAVPLLFKLSGIGKTRLNLHFGPQVAFLLSGEEVNTFNETTVYKNGAIPQGTYLLATTDDKVRTKEGSEGVGKFNKIDPSVVLGFGIEHDLTDKLFLSANLRFNYAFQDIRAQETVRDTFNPDVYTLRYNVLGGLQLGLHYFLQDK